MAIPQRLPTPDLSADLLAPQIERDDVFQLVRLLERMARLRPRLHSPVGGDGPPQQEAVRFGAAQHAAFPGAALASVEPDARDPARSRIALTSFGLTGPSGVLPQHYGALVRQRLKQRDRALADFLDLFNHRLISLYYRAWQKYRLAAQHEGAPAGDAACTRALAAFAGLPQGRPYQARLYYAGHFSRHTRSSGVLARMLSDFLAHPVRIEPFQGQWLEVPEAARTRLGGPGRGRNNRLGNGVLLGGRAWDVESRFRIVVGPLNHEQHEQLLPGTAGYEALKRLLLEYVPPHLEIELQFLIEDEPHRRRPLGRGLRLACNAWLQAGQHRRRTAVLRLGGGAHPSAF